MKIKVNGKELEISSNLSVLEYLQENNFNISKVAIEKDGEILSKALWKDTVLKSGKVYEIVEFVGGG